MILLVFVYENGTIKHFQGPKTLLGRLRRTTIEYWGIKVGLKIRIVTVLDKPAPLNFLEPLNSGYIF